MRGGGGGRSGRRARSVEATLAVGALEGGVGLGDERGAVGVAAGPVGVAAAIWAR